MACVAQKRPSTLNTATSPTNTTDPGGTWEQGEGAAHVEVWDGDHDDIHPDRDQVAHYYRFQELKPGRRYRRGDTPQSGPTGDTKVQAQALMEMPTEDGITTAGPTFEYLPSARANVR